MGSLTFVHLSPMAVMIILVRVCMHLCVYDRSMKSTCEILLRYTQRPVSREICDVLFAFKENEEQRGRG